MFAFDGTYLEPRLSQIALHSKRGLVGGMWKTGAEATCFLDLEDDGIDIAGVPKSSNMLECLVWDPSARQKNCLSVCSLPVEHNFRSVQGTFRSNWYVLDTIGHILDKANGTVRGIIFDAHVSHQHLRRVRHGQLEEVDKGELQSVPFFSSLTYLDLPPNPLPRLPIRLATMPDGEVVWGLPGVCVLVMSALFV